MDNVLGFWYLFYIYWGLEKYVLKITERNTWATATYILNSWVNVHGQAEQMSYFSFTIYFSWPNFIEI